MHYTLMIMIDMKSIQMDVRTLLWEDMKPILQTQVNSQQLSSSAEIWKNNLLEWDGTEDVFSTYAPVLYFSFISYTK